MGLLTKLSAKFKYSIVAFAKKRGFLLSRTPSGENAIQAGLSYVERAESGALNLECKLERVDHGQPFEWPNIVMLNHSVTDLIENEKNIIELGGGTGAFAFEASLDDTRHITCAEVNQAASEWASRNRSRSNINYVNRFVDPSEGPYDLVVSIEVIEHIEDFNKLLMTCASLAPRALITTPNRSRNSQSNHAGPPEYEQHVREWSAGEFYWVLRCYWNNVRLFAMPDEFQRGVVPITIIDSMTPLIADCREPRN